MYTTDLTNAMIQQVGFLTCTIILQTKTESKLILSLESVFLLDSSASIPVPKRPTYMMMTQMFNACNHDQQNAQNC